MDVRRRIGKQKNRLQDARQKLNTKSAPSDARFSLANKRKFSNKPTDARVKLVKKGLSDARYLLKNKPPPNRSSIKIKVDNNKQIHGKTGEMKNFQIIAKNEKKKQALNVAASFPKVRVENEVFKSNMTISKTVGRKRSIGSRANDDDGAPERFSVKRMMTDDNDDFEEVPSMRERLIARKDSTQSNQPNYSSEEYASPIQGFRILVNNLHRKVTHDDIVELFGNIGTLKRARLIKEGTAEAVFVNRSHAVEAVNRYHMRELDDQPMQVILTTKGKPFPKAKLPFTYKRSSNEILNVDPKIAHQVLFGNPSRNDSSNRPVSFTVKLDVDED